MVDRVVHATKKAQKDMWGAFKAGLAIKGYAYYEPPAEIKYRYPAPGSCSLDVKDHPNLYKNDWKVPYRNSDYYISKVEWAEDDDQFILDQGEVGYQLTSLEDGKDELMQAFEAQ